MITNPNDLKTNWRGMTVSSALFHAIIIAMAVVVTSLYTGHTTDKNVRPVMKKQIKVIGH